MNILEPCCYTKQFNSLLAEDPSDVVSVYHSGDIFAAHILERIQMLAQPSGSLYISLPSLSKYTLEFLQKVARRKYYDEKEKLNKAKFANIYILTTEQHPELEHIKLQPDQHLTAATSPSVDMNVIAAAIDGELPSDANYQFNVKESLIVTGSIVQSRTPGMHLLDIRRGIMQRDTIIPYLRSCIKVHKYLFK